MATKRLYYPLIIIIILVNLFSNQNANSETAVKSQPVNYNILILHSYHQGYEWTDALHKGIMENLLNIENSTIFTEYLDAQRNRSEEYLDLMEKVYLNKYRAKNIQFNLIIASDDNALQFLRLRRELFRKEPAKGESPEDVPIVFCGINNFAPENFEGLTNYTGVNEHISVNDTVQLALKLRPDAKKMAVISGCAITEQRNLNIFQQAIAELESSITESAEDDSNTVINRLKQLKIDYMNQLEPEEIKAGLKTYSKDDIIIYLAFLSTPSGKTYTIKESVQFIRSSSDAAIFGFWDFLLPLGAIGGKVAHGYSQGAEAAKLSNLILNGTPVSQIPVQMESPNKFVFNDTVLHKYDIPHESLPPRTIIMDKTAEEFIAQWDTISKNSFFGYDMFEKHGSMMWLSDPVTGIIVDANQSAIDYYGYPSLAGMNVSDINILPHEKVLANIKKAREKKQNYFLLKHRLADRRIIDVEVYAYPVIIADTTLMFAVVHDVTARLKAEQGVRQKDTIIVSTIAVAFLLQSCLIFYLIKSVRRRKKAENNLKNSNEELHKFKTIFDNANFGVAITELNGAFIYVNSYFAKVHGYSLEELAGKNLSLFHSEEQMEKVEQLLAQLTGHGGFYAEEVFHYHRNGTIFPMLMTGMLLKNTEGLPKYFTATAIDITERKKARQALAESEEKFRLAFHTNPDSINLNRLEDGCYIDINAGFTKIMGYTREEAIGKTSLELSIWKSPEDRARLVDCLKKNGYVENMEAQFVGKDGNIRDGLMSANVLKINDENVIISITRDNTERKKAQDALRESEEKYRSMMESMDDAAFICSSEHAIEYMNPAMSKKVGHNSIGEVCYKAIYGFNEPCPWCLSKKVLNGDSIKTEVISPNDNKNYSVSFSPIFHTDNTVSVLSVLRDITDIKTIETKLQQSQKMEAIGVLAGGIAHDFNNILSPIMGYTELLSEDIPKDSPLRSSLDEIYAASMRAKDMVRQILTFARQEKGEVKLMKMQYIVKEALKLIRSTVPTTIEIRQYISNDCGAINADSTQIHQIVMNLATNAYHAMEDTGGTMTISLKEVELNEQDIVSQDIQKGIYACLTVADTGTGIPENIKDKIFDPFFTTKEQGKGTGLGLSSVHGIVKSCGGAVRLHSEIGKGTEFNIYLPVAESYLKKDDVLQVNIPTQGGNERILLVDDEAVLITLQKGMLERLGYQVTSRTSSIEALEAFRANSDKFDMVITDMAMPSMSGDKLAVELIKIRPDIPVLLCTGFSTIMSEEKALSMGIKGFLMKPVTIGDIDKKIREVLKPTFLRA
ncbi:MAG: PAS domain S-box protein [Desulfamplus sp.]